MGDSVSDLERIRKGSGGRQEEEEEEDEEEDRELRTFSQGCTLVKVPALTANDPVFAFIAPIRHLSRYFRLTHALNGPIDISSPHRPRHPRLQSYNPHVHARTGIV